MVNRKIKLIGGIIAMGIGAIYLINSIFIGETVNVDTAITTRVTFLSIGLGLIGAGYYFGVRKKTSTKTNPLTS